MPTRIVLATHDAMASLPNTKRELPIVPRSGSDGGG